MINLLIGVVGGIASGMILARIAPEELESGKKYFLLFKNFIYSLLFLLVAFYFSKEQNFLGLGVLSALFVVLWRISLQSRHQELYEIPKYLLFIVPYFLISITEFQLLLSSFLFLYGMPTGTLLKMDFKT